MTLSVATIRPVVVIPAFNEADTIAAVVRTVLQRALPLVVDDGSSDGTADIAERERAEVVRHGRNRGYEAALSSGFRRAHELGAQVIATFDADGQFSGDALDAVLKPVVAGTAELAIGVRPRSARLGEALFGLYTRLRFGVPDILCGLKAYSVGLYQRHGGFDRGGSVGTELALAGLRLGVRWVAVPTPVLPRLGTPRFGSAWRANRRILHALWRAVRDDLRRD